MKYCAQYSNSIDMSIFDEIAIRYDRQEKELINFLNEHQDKKITLVVDDIDGFHEAQSWRVLNAIHEQYPAINLNVCLYNVQSFMMLTTKAQDCLEKLEVPYYTGLVATNFDQLHYLCQNKVSEVYLAEDICFD